MQLLEQVVKIGDITLCEDYSSRLASQNTLARVYQSNGQIQQAVVLLEKVVKIHKITPSKDHSCQLKSQNSLAGAYKANGQIRQAVEILEQLPQIEVNDQNSQP